MKIETEIENNCKIKLARKEEFLEDLKAINPNFKIFLDLKLYDIPNTMADAAEDISNFGLVDMFNVHASSGTEAMKTVMNRIKNIPNKPLKG